MSLAPAPRADRSDAATGPRALAPGEAARPAPPPPVPADPVARDRLARARRWAQAAQLGARVDLPRACALIGPPGEADADRLGPLLLAAMAEDGGRPARLHRPGARAASEDEHWLLALIARLADGDAASARFLVHRRVAPRARRLALFLAARLAEAETADAPRAAA